MCWTSERLSIGLLGKEEHGSKVTRLPLLKQLKAVFSVSNFQLAFSRNRQALKKTCDFFFQTELKQPEKI